jgi:hypothetical protein
MSEEEQKSENIEQPETREHIGVEEAPQPKKPGIFTRFHRWLYNPDTKFGRFNRRMRTAFIVALVFLGIGFGLTYFFLCRPTLTALQGRNADYDTLLANYTQAQKDLTAQYEEVSRLNSELTKTTDQLAKEQNHLELMRLLNDLMEAKYYIADDSFDTARTSLESAQTRLAGLETAIKAADPELYNSVSSRLEGAITDLRIKSVNTAMDITLIVNQLREFENKSFGTE